MFNLACSLTRQLQTRVMGQAKLCSWLLPTCLFCKLGLFAWVPHNVLRRPCSSFLKVLVCVLPVARASISIRVNQSALNSKCFYREWKWWVCKEDRTICVKAAQGPWELQRGICCLLMPQAHLMLVLNGCPLIYRGRRGIFGLIQLTRWRKDSCLSY